MTDDRRVGCVYGGLFKSATLLSPVIAGKLSVSLQKNRYFQIRFTIDNQSVGEPQIYLQWIRSQSELHLKNQGDDSVIFQRSAVVVS